MAHKISYREVQNGIRRARPNWRFEHISAEVERWLERVKIGDCISAEINETCGIKYLEINARIEKIADHDSARAAIAWAVNISGWVHMMTWERGVNRLDLYQKVMAVINNNDI